MAIKIVNYYLAEPYHPTYYVMLYNGQHSRTERPARPFQIFRADTWPEAKNFAVAFVSHATDQWMGVSSLSPKRGEQEAIRAIEVAHVDYWKEGDQVLYEESRLPAEVVRSMSEAITNEPIAREREDSETTKRMREAVRLMKSAKPGESLIDVLGRKYEAERAAKTRERMEHLKQHGDWSPEQGRLVPNEKPEEAAKSRPKGKTFLDEFEEAHELEIQKVDLGPGMGVYYAVVDKETMTTLDRFKDRQDAILRKEAIIRSRGRQANEKERYFQIVYSRATPNHPEGAVVPAYQDRFFTSEDEAYRAMPQIASRDLTVIEVPRPAKFKEAHEKEPTLSDARGWFPFRNWVINHKMPEADSMLLNEALDEAKVSGKDLTYDEAKDKVKQSLETSDKPWSVISQAIDWNTITLEEEQRHQVSEAAEIVKAALEAGIIQAKDVGLYRKNPAGMSVEEKRAFQKQIDDLERQLQEARKPPPSEYGTGKPSIRSAPLNYTQDQIDLLYNYFQNQLERSLKRSPSAPELNRFDEFINRIQRVRPAIKFDRLKGQVEDIAMALAALARGASIPRKTEAQRLRDLLEKMLTSELTPEEEDEVAKLEGSIETEENLPLGIMEPDRPRPHIRIIAESGPEQFLLGRPLAMDQPGPYPREIQRTWDMENAQINAENYRKKGYVIRIEEF